MKERPIICRDDEVRAFIEGRKTQLRRPFVGPDTNDIRFDAESSEWYCEAGRWHKRCPFGIIGERLWVRECFTPNHGPESTSPEHCIYRADDNRSIEDLSEACWTPSSQMPRWTSRITLTITNIRVERVQDITEKDAKAEGVYPQFVIDLANFRRGTPVSPTHRIGFKQTWDDVYNDGPGRYNMTKKQMPNAWINNPFVWALIVKPKVSHGR